MALADNPHIIILDEPAAGLAQKERVNLTELLLGLDFAITLLLVEHDMAVALQVAQLVTVMHNGRIIMRRIALETTSSALVADEEVQRYYLGVT